MLAVFETGGKQYCVRPGDVVRVEKLNAEGTVTFDRVLFAMDKNATLADPSALKSASVSADILETAKQDKVLVFKKKRRNNYRRLNGHRQTLTVLRIKDIVLTGAKPRAAQPEGAAKADTKTSTKAPEQPKKTAQKAQTKS